MLCCLFFVLEKTKALHLNAILFVLLLSLFRTFEDLPDWFHDHYPT